MRRTGFLLAAMALFMVASAGVALAAILDGTGRADRLVGTQGTDTIRAFAGNDTVYGRGGADNLSGNLGNDTIGGWDGDDTIYGGPGRDTVRGGEGDDGLFMRDGVAGNDAVSCGPGIDGARVDSRAEADVAIATCETVEYRAEATGVLRALEDGQIYVYSPYSIEDEASGASYLVYPQGRDLEPYVGRRVVVSGEATDDAAPPSLYVEHIDFAELEPAGR